MHEPASHYAAQTWTNSLETVQFGVRSGIRDEHSSSKQNGGADGSSFGENGPAAASDTAAS